MYTVWSQLVRTRTYSYARFHIILIGDRIIQEKDFYKKQKHEIPK